MSAITLDELLSELSHAKLLVSNLFQLDDESWRCNVRSKELAFEFYIHPNPTAAVRGAIALALHTQGVPLRSNKARLLPPKIEAKIKGAELLALLNLGKK